jgi:3-methylcrotonyl-CoA carboxylase alpha subunit
LTPADNGPRPSVLQVAGLPTNVPFLIRLATHPAFVTAGLADLNTAFIAQHRDELMAPQPVPPEVCQAARQ